MNPSKGCPGLEDLAAYLEGMPEGPARDRVESHLASCADCRGEVQADARLLKETSEAQDVPPPGFSAGLLRTAGVRTQRRTTDRRKPALAMALAAAGLLVAAGMAYFWQARRPPESVSPQATAPAPQPAPAPVVPVLKSEPPTRPDPRPIPIPERTEPKPPAPLPPDLPPKPEPPKPKPLPIPVEPEPVPPVPAPEVKPAPTRTTLARVHSIEGKVALLSEKESIPCAVNAELVAGTGLQTGPKSSAVVVFPDGTKFEVAAGTTIRHFSDLQGQGGTGKQINLEAGAVEAQVLKQPAGRAMVFVTPHAEARVVGTSLRIAVIGAKDVATRLEVTEGKVHLRRLDGKSVDVTTGHFAVAAAGGELVASRVTSLLLHWKLDGAKGSVAQDASGNGNDGLVDGEPGWGAGRMAGAVDLMKARVDSPHLDLGGELKSFTASYWACQETFAGFQDSYFQLIPGVSMVREANISPGRIRVTMKTEGPPEFFSFDSVLTKTNQWTHIAMTWDGALAILYRNGRDVAKAKVAGRLLAPDGFMVRLGGSPKIDAKMDDVRLYRRALTEAEIRDVMAGGTVR